MDVLFVIIEIIERYNKSKNIENKEESNTFLPKTKKQKPRLPKTIFRKPESSENVLSENGMTAAKIAK